MSLVPLGREHALEPQLPIYKMGSELGCENQMGICGASLAQASCVLLFFLDPCSPLARLQSLQHEYKLAALRAKHQDDTATATRHLRVAKVGLGPQTGPAVRENQRRSAGSLPGSSQQTAAPVRALAAIFCLLSVSQYGRPWVGSPREGTVFCHRAGYGTPPGVLGAPLYPSHSFSRALTLSWRP